jgi:signal peptidase II
MKRGIRYSIILRVVVLLLAVSDLYLKELLAQDRRVIFNFGGVFGILQQTSWIGIALMVWLVAYWQWLKSEGWIQVGLTFILGGGLGNIIDRIITGAVRDYIYYPYIEVYGNLADIYLMIGVLVVLGGHYEKRKNA